MSKCVDASIYAVTLAVYPQPIRWIIDAATSLACTGYFEFSLKPFLRNIPAA